jgi:hypothetical protein
MRLSQALVSYLVVTHTVSGSPGEGAGGRGRRTQLPDLVVDHVADPTSVTGVSTPDEASSAVPAPYLNSHSPVVSGPKLPRILSKETDTKDRYDEDWNMYNDDLFNQAAGSAFVTASGAGTKVVPTVDQTPSPRAQMHKDDGIVNTFDVATKRPFRSAFAPKPSPPRLVPADPTPPRRTRDSWFVDDDGDTSTGASDGQSDGDHSQHTVQEENPMMSSVGFMHGIRQRRVEPVTHEPTDHEEEHSVYIGTRASAGKRKRDVVITDHTSGSIRIRRFVQSVMTNPIPTNPVLQREQTDEAQIDSDRDDYNDRET